MKYYSGDQIKKNEMGRACGTYGGQERCLDDFGEERDHLEELGVDGRIIPYPTIGLFLPSAIRG